MAANDVRANQISLPVTSNETIYIRIERRQRGKQTQAAEMAWQWMGDEPYVMQRERIRCSIEGMWCEMKRDPLYPEIIVTRSADQERLPECVDVVRRALGDESAKIAEENYYHPLPREEILTAELHGKIVGVGGYFVYDGFDDANLCGFYWLAVVPEYQHCGIGSMLVEHTKSVAKARGFTAIFVEAVPTAVGFYGKHGFIPTTEVKLPERFPGTELMLCVL